MGTAVVTVKEERIPYPKDTPIHLQVYEARHYPAHYHRGSLELIYCIAGSVTIQAGFETVHLAAGGIFSVDHTDIHRLHSTEPNTVISIHIDLHGLELDWNSLRYIWFACETANPPPQGEEPMRRIQDLILSSAWRLTAPDDNRGCQVKEAANRLITLLLEYFDLYYYKKISRDPNNIMRDRFYRIISYCQKYYQRRITLAEIAEKENLNPFYLSQSVRNSTFLSLSRILGFIRCCHAEELLLTSDLPILEISAMCGFSDLKYFYHHFDAWWGCTPHQHRINHLEYAQTPPAFSLLERTRANDAVRDFIVSRFIEQTK